MQTGAAYLVAPGFAHELNIYISSNVIIKTFNQNRPSTS